MKEGGFTGQLCHGLVTAIKRHALVVPHTQTDAPLGDFTHAHSVTVFVYVVGM